MGRSKTAGPEQERTSGVQLQVPSLPGLFGIGDFGPQAYRFVDWLAAAGQSWWQLLPLTPTDPFYASSPYRSSSAFALNPLLISPELLVRDRLLPRRALAGRRSPQQGRIDYHRVRAWKPPLLSRAWQKAGTRHPGFATFCRSHRYWLDDYVLFVTIKSEFAGRAWADWPPELRDRDPEALRRIADQFGDELDRERFIQFVAWNQWQRLRRHCRGSGIRLIGDLPIYVDHDSADVWAHRELFLLDRAGRSRRAAGVPPDYFSRTGQLWGNPVYRWAAHRRQRFAWWLSRIRHGLLLFDQLRIDHFRGLAAYWSVPADAPDARGGHWTRAPGSALLTAIRLQFPAMPLVAEDLGHITPDVERLRRRFRLPGTRVLQFGFGADSPASPHRLDNLEPDAVVHTGTHDNDTTRGWFEHEASPATVRRLECLVGRRLSKRNVSQTMIRLALESRARIAIIPLQDVLGLGSRARLNTPGTTCGNWQWRVAPARLTPALARRLGTWTAASDRC